MRTPLLLHRSADRNTPAYHAEATYIALQRLGRRASYARYEGAGHAMEWWQRANVVDYWRRALHWLDETASIDPHALPDRR